MLKYLANQIKDVRQCVLKNNDKSTVESIARIVGVSSGTVSNALNNRKGVSEATRQEILHVARSIGYGRSQSRRAENGLRFVIVKRHGAVVDDTPFFSSLIKGIESESKRNGYDLLISHLNTKNLSLGTINELCDSSKGMIILATEMRADDLAWFDKASIPIVILDSYFYSSPYNCVLINNEQGIRLGTEYLIKMGHRDIGILDASQYINNFYYRRKSFLNTMNEYGLEAKVEIPITPTTEGAYLDMKAWLELGKELPEALVAGNDIIAFGAMRALAEQGISVPNDISIIGFDDMPFCSLSTPRLTTIAVPKSAMGRIAVKTLTDSFNTKKEEKLKVEIGTCLIERESVRPRENPAPLQPNSILGSI